MVDIGSMTPEELAAWLKEQGEPAFRATLGTVRKHCSASFCRRALDRSLISSKEVTPR